MSKLFNIWRQRSLTIMGKNLLINSLSTSLFLFNSQIEIPPIDFVKSVEKVHKDFLWSGGTPKIAHHTLIAEYEKGGIKYKDLNSFIAAINIKFIHNISRNPCSGNALLPNLWIKKLFKIPTNTEERGPYFYNYFSDVLNILDCNFKLPRKIKYKGHPFYYPILKSVEVICRNKCTKIENILSTPLWYNTELKSQFDVEISQAGFNFIKDIFPNNRQLVNYNNLRNNKIRKLRNLINNISQAWREKILQSDNCFVTIFPCRTVNLGESDEYFQNMTSVRIYSYTIADKTRLPTGLLRWLDTCTVSDQEIKFSFTFARQCSQSVFDWVFQYKILTNILPTNYYLKKYHVIPTDTCSKCLVSQDTIIHSLWQCQIKGPYVAKILNFLKSECKVTETLSIQPFIFGFRDNMGLNHVLLELKKEIFYNWRENVGEVCL